MNQWAKVQFFWWGFLHFRALSIRGTNCYSLHDSFLEHGVAGSTHKVYEGKQLNTSTNRRIDKSSPCNAVLPVNPVVKNPRCRRL